MRVIGGSASGVPLRVPRGMKVRPTSGRVRTSLFSMLGAAVDAARVLDLFAGSGSLGIEALSRGAAHCCFVEKARASLAALEANLAKTRLADRAAVMRADAFGVVAAVAGRPPFDLVLADPPYDVLRRTPARVADLLDALAASPALAPSALLVVEHDASTPLPETLAHLRVTDCRTYGTTALTWLEPWPRATGAQGMV